MWKLVILVCASLNGPQTECQRLDFTKVFPSLSECKAEAEYQVRQLLPVAKAIWPEGRLGARCEFKGSEV